MADKLLKSRRQFLQTTALGSAFAGFSLPLLAAQNAVDFSEILPESMRQAGKPFTNYGQPSPYEKDVIRWIAEQLKRGGSS